MSLAEPSLLVAEGGPSRFHRSCLPLLPLCSPDGEGPFGPGLRTSFGLVRVAPLALLLGSSALRSGAITRLPRYYGLC